MACGQTRLLAQLATGRLLVGLVLLTAPFGDLPGVPVERIAILSDEPDPPSVIDGQDTDRAELEVDHPVNAGPAIGAHHPVFAHGDPGILINEPTAQGLPRIGSFGIVHREIITVTEW